MQIGTKLFKIMKPQQLDLEFYVRTRACENAKVESSL